MKTIWKFEVGYGLGIYEIQMPIRANVISVGVQFEKIYLWAEVETDNELRNYKIFVRGTGEPFKDPDYDDECSEFIGTVQIHQWVWHIYQNLRSSKIEE